MRSMTLVGTEPVPIHVQAAIEDAGRTSLAFAGNVSADTARQLRAKLNVLLQPRHVACKYGAPNWLHGCATTISFEPSDVPVGPETEAAVLAAVYEQQPFGVGAWADNIYMVGEFGLDGQAQPLRNALAFALKARREGVELAIPTRSADEVAVLGASVYLMDDIRDLQSLVGTSAWIRRGPFGRRWQRATPIDQREQMRYSPPPRPTKVQPPIAQDLSEIKAQEVGKRALEISAAGGHNLLYVGPPGEGKTMLAHAMPGVLPPLSGLEAVEVTCIQRMKGMVTAEDGLIGVPPFIILSAKAATPTALIGGGGATPKPGVISLAHHGVLYVDEIHRLERGTAEALRGPLQDGFITVHRARWSAQLPARFIFVASTNPCPCGWHGHPTVPCTCSPTDVKRYQSKLSGPLLDRIPLIVPVGPLSNEAYVAPPEAEKSRQVRTRVVAARKRAARRKCRYNAEIPPHKLREIAALTKAAEARETEAATTLGLSTRSRDHLLRVSRTIADLAGSKAVDAEHLEEAAKFIDRRVLFTPKGRF